MKSISQLASLALKAFLYLSVIGLVVDVFVNLWVFLSHHYNWQGSIKKFYGGIDFTKIWQVDQFAFNILLLFAIVISTLKISLFRTAIKLLKKINVQNPFEDDHTFLLKRVCIIALFIGLISIVLKLYIEIAVSNELVLSTQMGDSSFVWFAAIVYIVTLIYQKGILLRSESELTI